MTRDKGPMKRIIIIRFEDDKGEVHAKRIGYPPKLYTEAEVVGHVLREHNRYGDVSNVTITEEQAA